MKRNITISLDEELARNAKILAARKDTSVSTLLADYLATILKAEKSTAKAKRDFFTLTWKKYLLNYSGRDFKRDALHER